MSKKVGTFAAAMEQENNTKKPIKWWLELVIAILAALAGMLTENATELSSNIINL